MSRTLQRQEDIARDGRALFVFLLASLLVLGAVFLLRPGWLDEPGAPSTEMHTAKNDSDAGTRRPERSDADGATTRTLIFKPPSTTPAMDPLEKAIMDETNRYRGQARLTELSPDGVLADVARQHSRDMANREYFAHVDPDGKSHRWRVARGHRTLIGLTAENLDRQSTLDVSDRDLARRIVAGWMERVRQRKNILAADLSHMGVGVFRHGDAVYATQLLASVWSYLDDEIPDEIGAGQSLSVSGRMAGGRPEVAALRIVDAPWSGEAESTAEFPAKTTPDSRFAIPDRPTPQPGTRQLVLRFGSSLRSGRVVLRPGPIVEVR
ncbi:MAG: CAP domain-containing protein [Proteobacteria bacterium]|nr:CAP domain-containing protein [Pseudomonadota bacterium]